MFTLRGHCSQCQGVGYNGTPGFRPHLFPCTCTPTKGPAANHKSNLLPCSNITIRQSSLPDTDWWPLKCDWRGCVHAQEFDALARTLTPSSSGDARKGAAESARKLLASVPDADKVRRQHDVRDGIHTVHHTRASRCLSHTFGSRVKLDPASLTHTHSSRSRATRAIAY